MACHLFTTSVVLIALWVPMSSSTGIKGLCGKTNHHCKCGDRNGFVFTIPVEECTFFYRWRPSCKPCDEIDQSQRCAPYTACEHCEAGTERCISCPVGRYGKWCNLACKCKNGATCTQDGLCMCLPGYHGLHCEHLSLCPNLMDPPGGTFSPKESSYTVGKTVTFTCDDKHFLQGTSTLQCLQNGQWSSLIPRCMPECQLIANPANGKVHLSSGRLIEGAVITYTCDPGYHMVGNATRTCRSTSWSGKQPICQQSITCDDPVEMEDGRYTLNRKGPRGDIGPGSTLEYYCDYGYLLVGEDSLRCQPNGSWSAEMPLCVDQMHACSHPGSLPNGVMKPQGLWGKYAFMEGASVEYSCLPLYYLVGKTNSACGANGTWTSEIPTCLKLTTCPALDKLANGKMATFVQDSQSTKGQNVFRVAGTPENPGMTSRLGFGPRFRTVKQNDSQDILTAKLRAVLPVGHFHVGTRVMFSCESQFYDLVGSQARTCMTNGIWSGRQPTCIPVCGRSSAPKKPFITHGVVSDVGQWPWQVGLARLDLENNWFLLCGGALISERWVLTAAHCVTYAGLTIPLPLEEVQLYFGKHFRNYTLDDSEVQVRKVEEMHVHHEFNPVTYQSDIALLRINPPVKFTSRVQVVCLPDDGLQESNERIAYGKSGTVSGWGFTENETLSEVLQHTEVPVVPSKQCEEEYRAVKVNIVVTKNMFCAGYEHGNFDSCEGDSGGPIVFPKNERRDTWVLEGLVSWGSPHGCGKARQYGGYLRVHPFLDWINHFI